MHETLREALEALPNTGIAVLGVVFILGLCLWLIGGMLARFACGLMGLVAGGLLGFAFAWGLGSRDVSALPWIIGGGVLGSVIAALAFRAWTAGIGAIVLAMAVPVGALLWQGIDPLREETDPPPAMERELFEGLAPDAGLSDVVMPEELQGHVTIANPEVNELDELFRELRGVIEASYTHSLGVWNQLSPSSHTIVVLGIAMGAGAGLVLGLLFPNILASLEAALVGSVLMLASGYRLLLPIMPTQAAELFATPRGLLLSVGLITLTGTVLQWTVLRKKADS